MPKCNLPFTCTHYSIHLLQLSESIAGMESVSMKQPCFGNVDVDGLTLNRSTVTKKKLKIQFYCFSVKCCSYLFSANTLALK